MFPDKDAVLFSLNKISVGLQEVKINGLCQADSTGINRVADLQKYSCVKFIDPDSCRMMF